ncbi:MAG: hypothetical protein UR39_C0009G0019 [Candidatus Woesebacteria bacterium GW2011_GWA1_33_30]|uniref:Transposase IS200-like domain-containing protein n=1 Tax=Candidatus Woesebacteria bacterium GW2011_GWA2_33_28 TaxID=1618561 RepID=A0A0G0CTH4_9BACT|nr:MAG: hypothetical protein UR38_C0009G0019 [Candidatus Woesebacteria bacterium GW2011_GWA2_33_28]KKP47548.1 MAG: hypothetical protein UR39_C0009G0019 [Candidatus Woesebacteria bacterium GW2011_GWA1_33_30]KKP49160.1 MAG: hypothetical protein UR40_C0010G0019 [Microgenomates group bacterium GW2011_GWC1_33_32]KKP51542.1 MAG: hypothetical protein UR44_C0009G0019 [Candidatus Woesebacteria bacterium GW2011_GWB1_33_38]KKP57726.1 MAG: hypothetical protein UR48_C0011G0014 [Microgenomates group bacteriu
MPAKNSIKLDIEETYYHVYNRGVDKRIIFEDEQDHKVFLNYLKEYLSPPRPLNELEVEVTLKGSTFKGIPRLLNNYFDQIHLLAYCLMPNHFHLLIKQKDIGMMKNFMRSLGTRYSVYFNKRYERSGSLFQGIYKAIVISNENYLVHLSRYIHLNPVELKINPKDAYSSYDDYIGLRNTSWIETETIKSYFSRENNKMASYKSFVESMIDKKDNEFIQGYTLDLP